MRRALKWIGIVIGVLIGLLIVAAVGLYISGTSRLNRTYDIEAETVTIPADEAALARGGYLAAAVCSECHSGNFAGELLIEEPGIAALYAPNLTPGEGGIGDLTDADLILAIRHGIDQDGSHLMYMPAEIFIHWSEADLGAVIAFLRNLPPVDNVVPEPQTTVLAHILLGADQFGEIFPAEYIDHNMPFPNMPEIGVNEEYGRYLVAAYACTLCHDDNLAGGITPRNAPPGAVPLSPNLTGDHLADWTEADFMTTLRTGERPDGSIIDPEFMPTDLYARVSGEDLQALWLYVQSLPAAGDAGQ